MQLSSKWNKGALLMSDSDLIECSFVAYFRLAPRHFSVNLLMNRSFSTSADDHLCSICLRIFLDPQQTPSCSHIFCRKCASKNLQKMKEPKCPMCRADLLNWLPELQPQDEAYMQFLRTTFPTELADREREDAEEAQDEKYMIVKQIAVGNFHQLLGGVASDNRHRWTMFVRDPAGSNLGDLIDRVQFVLHPTFHPPIVEVTQEPFEVTRIGWGVFMVRVRIHFRAALRKDPIEYLHMLSFQGSGSFQMHSIEYDQRDVESPIVVGSPEEEEAEEEAEDADNEIAAVVSNEEDGAEAEGESDAPLDLDE